MFRAANRRTRNLLDETLAPRSIAGKIALPPVAPFAAIATPFVLAGDWVGRWLLPIEKRDSRAGGPR
ncbi:MAG: hypothetical protein Fur0037_18620 [Planctomycetota bacterium]